MADEKVLQNGYYISAYVHIDEIANLYEIQVRHDQSIALWKYENHILELIHYWELERITGVKRHYISFYDHRHFEQFLNELLSEYNITIKNIVEIWGVPHYSNTKTLMAKIKGISYHSLAHVYSLLFSDMNKFRNENYLILAVDGGPDNEFDKLGDVPFIGCYSEKGVVKAWIPVSSPGPLWSIAKQLIGLEEGSLMALMSGCTCQYETDFEISDIKIEGINDISNAYTQLNQIYCKINLIDFNNKNEKKYIYDIQFTDKENRISMFMKLVKSLSDRMMVKNIRQIADVCKIDFRNTYLGITGGYALNCPSNSYLTKKFLFKGFYEIPCVSDTGIALGYGLGEFFQRDSKLSFKLKSAFYGNRISKNVIDYVESEKYNSVHIERFISDIQEEVVIWAEGRAEIGPRALGHRSLIANPTRIESKELLNKIKEREWWRPVAPIILVDEVKSWFQINSESKYMLQAPRILTDKMKYIPAVAHLDDSARIQTINDDSGLLYKFLYGFYQKTGIPILCNTSLNGKGQPIIDDFNDIIEFARKSEIKVCYIDGVRYLINDFNKNIVSYEKKGKEIFFSYKNNMDIDKLKNERNPFSIPFEELVLYCKVRRYLRMNSLSDKKNVKLIKYLMKKNSLRSWYD